MGLAGAGGQDTCAAAWSPCPAPAPLAPVRLQCVSVSCAFSHQQASSCESRGLPLGETPKGKTLLVTSGPGAVGLDQPGEAVSAREPSSRRCLQTRGPSGGNPSLLGGGCPSSLVLNIRVAEHVCLPGRCGDRPEDSRPAQVTGGHRQEGFVWACLLQGSLCAVWSAGFPGRPCSRPAERTRDLVGLSRGTRERSSASLEEEKSEPRLHMYRPHANVSVPCLP